ncbi:MAG: protein kinase [Herpetosiphonaceae bacterium]|nr:protein kinase [Herpetosiphonaceae bacterium]
MNAPPLLHDRYRIHAKLGDSRLASVYRAQDERLQRPVLVHLLKPELLATLSQRFAEEAQRGAQRSHPGLLDVYDTGEVGQRPYMVTEDVVGQPLTERVPLPAAQAVGVLRTIVGAVALAQSQGAPHPPISSRNVWICDGGRAILLENWQLSPREAGLDLAHYRAPERVRGEPPSPATTVYALGILAWETLVGRRPFTGPTPDAIATQQLAGEILPLSHVLPRVFSPELDRIIDQAVASKGQMRYPTPTDFGRALDLYVDGVTAHTGRLAILQHQYAHPSQVARDTQVLPAVASEIPTMPTARPQARAVAPPPPPAIIRQPPARPTRRVPPPPRDTAPAVQVASQGVAPVMDQQAMAKEVQRAMRKELRRQSCQRSLLSFAWRLVVALMLFAALYFGGGYLFTTINNYVTGQVQRLTPGQVIARQLPHWDWVTRLLKNNTPDIPLATTYHVTALLHMRDGPNVNGTKLRDLQPGTVIRSLGQKQLDDQGTEWIYVLDTTGGPQRGWVANLPDALQKQ